VQVLVTIHKELTLVRTAACRSSAVYEIARIKRQPIGCRILMPLYKGSPPGHPTFFLLSTAGGNVAADVAAVHDLQLAFRGRR